MKILVIGKQFNGAYGSLNYFIKEIFAELKKMKCDVYMAKTNEEAIYIYNQIALDFSIGIGKYDLYREGKKLYDYYQITHYQWIIDNPLKMELDTESIFIKYILIDALFANCMKKPKKKSLFLPLGVPERIFAKFDNERIRGIVFAGQIRNINQLYCDIECHKYKKQIRQIIDCAIYNIDVPFISVFQENVDDMMQEDKKEIFSLSNSFLRAYKREKVIKEIENYPVYLIGENQSEEVSKKKNVISLGKMTYYETFEIMKRYMFVLNIEPNFNNGFHDRVLRSISNGNLIVTNDGEIQQTFLGTNAILYSFSDISLIEDKISHLSQKQLVMVNKELLGMVRKYFSWGKILSLIIDDYQGGIDYENNRLYRILGN